MTKSMKVLVAYDGSPRADEALEDLQRAGLPDDVEATVLSVADLWFLPDGEAVLPSSARVATIMGEARATAATMMEAAKVRAESACERIRRQFPAWQVKAKSVADSPAWAIIAEAEESHADLIFVGSHGYSQLGRWVLGSVSQTVLTHAPCSVRIARSRRTPPTRPLRILVGVDGSDEADEVVRTIAQRVWPTGSDIRLLMVMEPSIFKAMESSLQPPNDSSSAADDDSVDRIERKLEDYLAIARQSSGEICVSTALLPGDPKQIR
jgi:nucleotide-binding universal stress UspA family protein